MKKDEKELFWRLRKKIQEFEKLDTELSESVKSGNFAILGQILNAKKEIKKILFDEPQIKANGNLSKTLKKIRDNYGYNIDKFVGILEKTVGETVSQEREEEKDCIDGLFSEGSADYVDQEFYRRKNEVGTIISSQTLPENFLNHLEQAKECYALGLTKPTLVFCRAIIESGVFESLRRRGKISTDMKKVDIGEYSLKELMRMVRPFVSPFNYDETFKVIKHTNDILHSKRAEVNVSETDAFNAIKSSFAIIEELFQ